MNDMAIRRGDIPSFADPPEWLRGLKGFDLFSLERRERGSATYPAGVTEDTEYPGGTWRVSMMLPADFASVEGFTESLDPLVLVVLLANGAAQVEAKLAELVALSRSTGKSWTEVGQALGISKQAAWERYSGEE